MYTDVYICILNNSYVKFNVYDLSICINKVVISVFACPNITHIMNRFATNFDWGTHGKTSGMYLGWF